MCPDCEARRKMAREALMKSAIGPAAVQVLKGAAEFLGLKEKTGEAELQHQAPAGTKPKNPGRAGSRPSGQTSMDQS